MEGEKTMTWQTEVTKEMEENGGMEYLTIKDGETKTITFISNGEKVRDEKYKRDVIEFQVKEDGKIKTWQVSGKAYTLLNPIIELGETLDGHTITVSRKGKELDTKWIVVKTE